MVRNPCFVFTWIVGGGLRDVGVVFVFVAWMGLGWGEGGRRGFGGGI